MKQLLMLFLQSVFRWIYCLRIPEALLILALVTYLFLCLHKKYAGTRSWSVFLCICTMIWVGTVAVMTLGVRAVDSTPKVMHLIPFHSYTAVFQGETPEILRSNFMNALLFYPAGLTLGSGLPQKWKPGWKLLLVALPAIAVSSAIEFCQYRFGLGMAEIDDVIHNVLGALIGVVPCISADYLKARNQT